MLRNLLNFNYAGRSICNSIMKSHILRKNIFRKFSESKTNTQLAIETAPMTTELQITDASEYKIWPCFRLMDSHGKLLDPNISFDKATVLDMYRMMGKVQALDDVFYQAQRQGRISFYMQNAGEEAIQIGSASVLSKEDMIFAQYREAGVLLWRGFTLQEAADQCFSNESDLGKGRQMPVHYGKRELNFQTISSPLTTQLPQAVGAAYAYKNLNKNAVVICYFGEGAASEGDFHAAMNFASTLEVPIVFFCRNNGYAISTPVVDQYRGDGIISRAIGYGMNAIRVDGNDVFAVQSATRAAREVALEKCRPVFIEAMSYRRGHHSTSDDSTRYRSLSEIKHWQEHNDPMKRLRYFMESQGWWDDEKENSMRDMERVLVMQV
jgi:2-oxoisovalerate dehydrogenase E1 component alpha subunit